MSAPRALAWLLGPILGLAVVGCGEEESRGSLMLAISTDMYIDKDVSRVDIIVQPERGPTQSAQINLFPGLEGQFLPGTFSIVEGSKAGEFVRIRVIARQQGRVRVVREAALKVPRQRTALLSMPIQWLCDGQVRPDGQLHRSDCEDGYTCITGTCQPEAVDELTLPDYEAEEVFGGGNATGGGSCFETLDCFQGAVQPALDLATCRLATPVSDDLNIGVVLPLGSDGHCTGSECWIPLDRSSLTGWSEVDGTVQLPAAVCERAATDGARVLASTGCASKSPDTPTCGPWTLVGTTPGGDMIPDPNVVLSGPFDNRTLALELATTAQRLASEVVTACSSVALLSPGDTPGIDQLEATCELAESSIAPAAPLTWHRMPTRCWSDGEARLECERSCAAECSPGTLSTRCMAGLAGDCSGTCDSRICLGTEAVPTVCAGGCAGECDGTCDGACVGQCDGSCDLPSPDGFCEGRCTGTCTGLCQGRCEGTCAGRCDLDPMLEAGACSEGTECVGACSTGFDAATCDGPLMPSPCQLDPGCEGNCQVLAQFAAECNEAAVWIMPGSGQNPALMAALDSSLPKLLAIQRQASMVLDEAVRLRDRMSLDPNVNPDELASVQADVDLLQRVTASVMSIFLALGPERSSFPVAPGPVTCDVFRATGAPALIDDFEDGNSLVLPNDGRSGGWHTTHDGTGELLMTSEPPIPTEGGANGTTKALHLSGSAFTEWGAGFALDFRPNAAPYDASVHEGVHFWAKGVNRLRVILTQANLAPGHACSTCPIDGEECGLFYSSEVFLSDIWTEYFVAWTTLGHAFQGGTAVGPDQLMTLQFETPAAAAVDFWIDEISFY